MTLELKLKIEAPELRYQEDAFCELAVANRGNAPVTTFNPGLNPALLRLRVLNVKTGAETVYAPTLRPGALPPRETPLKAGEVLQTGFPLLRLPKALLPGEYDVSAILLFNRGAGQAESPPARVKVRATTPRHLFLDGGLGVWLNVHAEPPEVVLMSFRAVAGGGPDDLRAVATASLRAEPLFSRGPSSHHWIAWTEDGLLKFLHQHKTAGLSALRAFPLSSAKDVLVAPLHSDATPDDDSRPGGAALLYRDSGELETVKLGVDQAASLARAPLPGPRPLWIRSFEREGGRRSVLIVQAKGDRVALSEASWPGGGGPVRPLGEWPGTFMGAGAAVGGDDLLGGTLLLRQLAGARLAWDRIDFTLAAKGAFEAAPSAGPVSDSADPFDAAPRVRREEEAVAALLKTSKGFWWVYDGKSTFPVPHDLRQTAFPLEIALLNRREPVLIAGFQEAGFHMRMADGRPLPPNRD